ncbi:MAG: hypothetical protein J2P46_15610 [Zavarzinella sp.]|nr:hypothetical protein [Zavarzinella sp.]
MTTNAPAPTDPPGQSERWAREVLAAADALRQTGHHKRLREVTIVLPIDLAAVEAIELACLALAQGELSPAAEEFEQYLVRLAADPSVAARFMSAVRNVIARVMPPPGDTPV